MLQTLSTVRFTKEIDLDDLDHNSDYDPVRAYTAAKLENVLFTTELHRRHHADGLSAASFCPGNVATNFASDTTNPVMRLVHFLGTSSPLFRRLMLSAPEQGADQIMWLAEGTPGTDWRSGAYYYRRRVSTPRNCSGNDCPTRYDRPGWVRRTVRTRASPGVPESCRRVIEPPSCTSDRAPSAWLRCGAPPSRGRPRRVTGPPGRPGSGSAPPAPPAGPRTR